MEEQIIVKFRTLDAELSTRHPDARRDAEVLAAQVVDPATASADAVWRQAWDKPLFANTKVAIGVAAIAKLECYMPVVAP